MVVHSWKTLNLAIWLKLFYKLSNQRLPVSFNLYVFLFSFFSFLAISSINFGFNSASILSTMLEIALGSEVEAEEPPSEDAAAAMASGCAAAGSSSRRSLNVAFTPSGVCEVEPTMVSRICLQFAHAAALALARSVSCLLSVLS